ncbi:MAG: molybdenum cofactor guanylyltransferase, partial [Gammaproteobacteria bacterium]|nr:molybdenum cofactor guanylyltransferase [Gammaproteobacteria bacterium]
MSDIPVNGLILAGGKSRRMGQDKALLDRGGQSQLAYLAGLLDKKVERVFVSTRADQKDDGERCKYAQIVDRYDDMGPLAGILSAMEEHPDSDWLVVACDLPNITGETITHLLKNCSADHPFTAYVSSHDGLPEPLCAIYRAGSIAIMRRFADEGIYCPRKILIRSDT